MSFFCKNFYMKLGIIKGFDILESDIQKIFDRTKLGKSKKFYIESSEFVRNISNDRVLVRLRLRNHESYKEARRVYGVKSTSRNIVIEISKSDLRDRKLRELFD